MGRLRFLDSVLAQVEEHRTRQFAFRRRGDALKKNAERVGGICQVKVREILAKGRPRQRLGAGVFLVSGRCKGGERLAARENLEFTNKTIL